MRDLRGLAGVASGVPVGLAANLRRSAALAAAVGVPFDGMTG